MGSIVRANREYRHGQHPRTWCMLPPDKRTDGRNTRHHSRGVPSHRAPAGNGNPTYIACMYIMYVCTPTCINCGKIRYGTRICVVPYPPTRVLKWDARRSVTWSVALHHDGFLFFWGVCFVLFCECEPAWQGAGCEGAGWGIGEVRCSLTMLATVLAVVVVIVVGTTVGRTAYAERFDLRRTTELTSWS